jgi:hypothetical protein
VSGEIYEQVQPAGDTQPQTKRPRQELQRILISQPMSTKPFEGYLCPHPHLLSGEQVQVTAHYTEHGEIVERWQLSDTDVRWYRLEAWKQKWVTLKVDSRTPIT